MVCFRLGSNPDLFPFSALEEQLQKFGKFGMLSATFILPVITKEVQFELGENIDASKDIENEHGHEQRVQQKISDTFKKRFRDIAADSLRLGYI